MQLLVKVKESSSSLHYGKSNSKLDIQEGTSWNIRGWFTMEIRFFPTESSSRMTYSFSFRPCTQSLALEFTNLPHKEFLCTPLIVSWARYQRARVANFKKISELILMRNFTVTDLVKGPLDDEIYHSSDNAFFFFFCPFSILFLLRAINK